MRSVFRRFHSRTHSVVSPPSDALSLKRQHGAQEYTMLSLHIFDPDTNRPDFTVSSLRWVSSSPCQSGLWIASLQHDASIFDKPRIIVDDHLNMNRDMEIGLVLYWEWSALNPRKLFKKPSRKSFFDSVNCNICSNSRNDVIPLRAKQTRNATDLLSRWWRENANFWLLF